MFLSSSRFQEKNENVCKKCYFIVMYSSPEECYQLLVTYIETKVFGYIMQVNTINEVYIA